MPAPAWMLKIARVLYSKRFLLARLTHLPLVGELAERLFFASDRIIFLPQRQTIAINTSVEPENYPLPAAVLEHFIQHTTHAFIMDACLCRSSNNCQAYSHELGCLFLGEAVLKINPKLGRLVSKQEALLHVCGAVQVGLVPSIARSRIDAVLFGAAPVHKLLTICFCCPCCCVWNALPLFNAGIAQTLSRMPGLEMQVTERCTGCGVCTQGVCFADAIQCVNGRAVISADCRACGRCVEECPQDAIEVQVTDDSFIKATIAQISALVDVS